jgi:hypothetical protein
MQINFEGKFTFRGKEFVVRGRFPADLADFRIDNADNALRDSLRKTTQRKSARSAGKSIFCKSPAHLINIVQ